MRAISRLEKACETRRFRSNTFKHLAVYFTVKLSGARHTPAIWAAFPLVLLLLAFKCSCQPADSTYLTWWPWWIQVWKFGAGLCDAYSYRLYLVTLASAWLLHSAVSLWLYARGDGRAYLAAGLFWAILGHMVWV